MRKLRWIYALTLAAGFGLAATTSACPLCKEAAESAVESRSQQDEYSVDPLAEARAYNNSIYAMLAVPYTFFVVGGIYCYRHLRRNQALPKA